MHDKIVIEEANQLLDVVVRNLPQRVDGKDAILELKQRNYHWRQMEWIGWYFEYRIFTILSESIGGTTGPAYGNTTFDYKRQFVWDLKAHPKYTNKGTPNEPMILNDREAIEKCVTEKLGLGFIVVNGSAESMSPVSLKRGMMPEGWYLSAY
jgi:hypothetical protein